MKKFAVIFAVLFVAFAINANAINDNSTIGSRTGTGSFQCAVWNALSLTNDGPKDLGTFVAGYDYNITDVTLLFTITGEAGQLFYYDIDPDDSEAGCHLILTVPGDVNGKGSLTLSGTAGSYVTGTNTLGIICTEVHATAAGAQTFTQTVKVSYNNDL